MGLSKLCSPTTISLSFIATSALVGWFIPAFYEWTGSDQSRPSPLLGQFAWAMTIGGSLICLSLPWLPIAKTAEKTDRPPRIRFRLRTLLLGMTVIGITLAALRIFPMVVSSGLCALAFGYFVSFAYRFPQYRWPAAALVASMCLPYAWIIGYDELDRILPALLWMVAGFPAFLPTALLSRLVGQHFQYMGWLSVLLTAFELLFGIWMIRLGTRRTIAVLVVAMLTSTFGSFAFYQLCIF
jgi:hypothetical protein